MSKESEVGILTLFAQSTGGGGGTGIRSGLENRRPPGYTGSNPVHLPARLLGIAPSSSGSKTPTRDSIVSLQLGNKG